MIYEECLKKEVYPSIWKRANVIPVHKKNSRQAKTNYRPISLLPIFGKVFEKLIYDSIYRYLYENDILTPHQSGFRPGDSKVNQVLAITHKIYSAFEATPTKETRAVFLDLSKAFDRVWHDGLLYKLECCGISGGLLSLITSFLTNREQRVVLNGKSSVWKKISAEVPQGSVLSPLFFVVYINDLPNNITSDIKLFADDTSLFSVVYNVNRTAAELNNDLERVRLWAWQWKMHFNAEKTEEIIFSTKMNKPNHPVLMFGGNEVVKKTDHKHLGIVLDEKLNFQAHITEAISKARRGIGLIRYLSQYVPRHVLDQIYKLHVRPHLDYGDIVYHKHDPEMKLGFTRRLKQVQYSAALDVKGAWWGTSSHRLYEELGWESLYLRRWCRCMCHFFNLKKTHAPAYLYDEIPVERNVPYSLRRHR